MRINTRSRYDDKILITVLRPGDVFLYDGFLFLLLNDSSICIRNAVNLETGKIQDFCLIDIVQFKPLATIYVEG